MRRVAGGLLLALMTLAPAGAEPLIYTGIREAFPEVRSGRAFVAVRAVGEALGATVQWTRREGTVRLRRAGGPDIILTLGSTAAAVGGTAVTLDAAPYVTRGRMMVPVRFLAESLGAHVTFHAATRTVRFPVGNRLYILPLYAGHSGIIFETPAPGVTVGNPILLQGVANVYEGDFPIELQLKGGGTIACSFAMGRMGNYYPFSTRLYYNNTRGETLDAVIVAYEYGGRDDEPPTIYTLKVRLLPTD
jgi:hypothetical protein